jgi:hypothetical protein
LPEIINIELLTIGRRFYSQMKQGLASNLLMDVSMSGEGQERDLQVAMFLQGYNLVVAQ